MNAPLDNSTGQPAGIGTPEDWQALRELVTLYCRGIDRRDIDILRSIFHPEARLDFGASYFVGDFETWVGGVLPALQQFGLTQHHVTNSLFRFDGDQAVGETYLIAYHILPTPENGLFIAGARYLDRFKREAGSWQIIERVAIQDWQSPAGTLSGIPLGSLDRGDASYRLFGELGRQS